MKNNKELSKIKENNSIEETIDLRGNKIKEENEDFTTSKNGFQSITDLFDKLKIKGMKLTIAKFFIPLIIAFIGIIILYFIMVSVYDYEHFKFLGVAMIFYFFGPAGKETIIPATVAGSNELNSFIAKLPFDIGPINENITINPFIIGISIAFVDIVVSLFLVWNFDLAKRIPILGRIIKKIEEKGEKILKKKPWIERLAFTGIILYVMIPIQGSGGLVASILGRVAGLKPIKIFLSVTIGSISGCLLIAYSSNAIINILKIMEPLQIIISLFGIAIIFIIVYFYIKFK